MDDIIKAMRVLSELSAQASQEIEQSQGSFSLHDSSIAIPRLSAVEVFAYGSEILSKAADRLERDSKNPGAEEI